MTRRERRSATSCSLVICRPPLSSAAAASQGVKKCRNLTPNSHFSGPRGKGNRNIGSNLFPSGKGNNRAPGPGFAEDGDHRVKRLEGTALERPGTGAGFGGLAGAPESDGGTVSSSIGCRLRGGSGTEKSFFMSGSSR